MTPTNPTNPNTAINLIRDEFDASLNEIKQLTPLDRQQLASGIANNRQIPMDQRQFQTVAY